MSIHDPDSYTFAMIGKLHIHISEALENLRRAKLKSVLASLGIIIGAASIVAITNLGEASSRQALAQFKAMQPNVWLLQWPPQDNGSARAFPASVVSTLESRLTEITSAATVPYMQFASGKNNSFTLAGYSRSASKALGLEIQFGRMLLDADHGQRTVVLGSSLARRISNDRTSTLIGRSVMLGFDSFLVVGILKDKIYPAVTPFEIAESAFTSQDFPGPGHAQGRDKIIMRLDEAASPEAIKTKFESILADLQPQPQVIAPNGLISLMNQNARTMANMLAAIAAVAATLSAAGIFNLLTMVVRERRREIGIRLSIGALPSDIFLLFLTEAVGIAALAGATGVLAGCGISLLAQSTMALPHVISPLSVILGTGISVITAVVGATYPAWQASRVEPVQALAAF